MLKEDYVSLETAKLLKEKGFKVWSSHCYGLDVRHNGEPISFDEECELKDEGRENEIEYVDGGRLYNFGCSNENHDDEKVYAAPTLGLAMKWLREEHNLTVDVFHCNNWKANVKTIPDDYMKAIYDVLPQTDTYEEACEAGIRYCLENLI